MKTYITTVLVALSMVGCTSIPVAAPSKVDTAIKAAPVIIDTACNWVRPIYVHELDKLTAGTARQILAYNETWEKTCANKKK